MFCTVFANTFVYLYHKYPIVYEKVLIPFCGPDPPGSQLRSHKNRYSDIRHCRPCLSQHHSHGSEKPLQHNHQSRCYRLRYLSRTRSSGGGSCIRSGIESEGFRVSSQPLVLHAFEPRPQSRRLYRLSPRHGGCPWHHPPFRDPGSARL